MELTLIETTVQFKWKLINKVIVIKKCRIFGRGVKKSCHYYEILIKDILFTIYKVYYLGNERLKELIMGRFTENIMERVEDSLHCRKKPIVVKLNS